MAAPHPKVDLKKTLDHYQATRGQIRALTVPPTRYLMVDGTGDPNTGEQFTQAVEALYPVAYKTKFASRADLGRDYVVMPLEGLWWADRPEAFTTRRDKSVWQWTLMIMIPDWVDDAMVAAAIEAAGAKDPPARLAGVRIGTLEEGRCLQTLHVGAYEDEGTLIELLHREAAERGLSLAGHHHEIYLSDFRTAAPAKLRTILRQPVT